MQNGRVRGGWLIAAAVWGLGYLIAYLGVARAQDDRPVWWYVVLLACGVIAAALAGSARTRLARGVGFVALACLFVAAVVAVASIGLFLLPAVGLAGAGLILWGERTADDHG